MENWILQNVRIGADSPAVDLAISGDRVASLAAVPADTPRIDGGGGLLLRPFTDSHHHLDKAFTLAPRQLLPADIFASIEATTAIKREQRGQVRTVSMRMARVLDYLHAAGTRAVNAQIDVDEIWGLTGIEAALLVRQQYASRLRLNIVAFPQHGMNANVRTMLQDAASLGVDGIGGHTDLDQDWMSHLASVAEIASSRGLWVDIHTDETASAQSYRLPGVVEVFHGYGRTSVTHCISIARLAPTEREAGYAALVGAGIRVNVAPCVVAFGGPLFPVAEGIQAGVEIGIGSDNLRDHFVPTGTGNVHELGRILGIVQRIGDPAIHDAIAEGMTNRAWSQATGADDLGQPGSDASFQVWAIPRAGALLNNPSPPPHLRVWRGQIEPPTSTLLEA